MTVLPSSSSSFFFSLFHVCNVILKIKVSRIRLRPPSLKYLRNLSDKLYEKRKNAAIEVEGIVKQLASLGDHEKISEVISLLTTEYTYSPQANRRKGGLIGLAAATVGLTSEAAQHLQEELGLAITSASPSRYNPTRRVR